jgi:hypothetical protein
MPPMPNGVCVGPIAAGLGFPITDGTDITRHFTDTSRAGGVAHELLTCAVMNACAACLN